MTLCVLAVADQVSPALYDYFDPERWRQVDLILSCGDLPPDYLDFLCTSLGVPLLYVRGNHDGTYDAAKYEGLINVHARIVRCCGVRVAGFEGCMRYNHGSVQYTHAEMRRMARGTQLAALVRGKPDIVLTHAPPLGCQDAPDRAHRGFDAFNRLIEIWRPRYLIHGHTHAYDRDVPTRSLVHGTTVINAYPYQLLTLQFGAQTKTGPVESPPGPQD